MCNGYMMGPPPGGTFDIDSDVGPNWETDAGSEVDIADSEPEVNTVESELSDGPHRIASHSCTMGSKFVGSLDVGYEQRMDVNVQWRDSESSLYIWCLCFMFASNNLLTIPSADH